MYEKWPPKGLQMGELISGVSALGRSWGTFGAPIRFLTLQMSPKCPQSAPRSCKLLQKWPQRHPKVQKMTSKVPLKAGMDPKWTLVAVFCSEKVRQRKSLIKWHDNNLFLKHFLKHFFSLICQSINQSVNQSIQKDRPGGLREAVKWNCTKQYWQL